MNDKNITLGYSTKTSHPEIEERLRKSRKTSKIFGVVLILLPALISLILSIVKNDFSTLVIGIIISAVFLVFNLFSLFKRNLKSDWEGTVVKQVKQKEERKKGDEFVTETVYFTFFEKTNGKSFTLKEVDTYHPYFDYLHDGDRVKYHKKFNNFFEKYDKTKDDIVICPLCGQFSDISGERCEHCNAPLIK